MAPAHRRRQSGVRHGLSKLPRMLNDLLFRMRAIFRRRRLDADLQEELRWHLDHETEKLLRSGIPEEEAKRRATLALGGFQQVTEECRDSRGIALLTAFSQ